MKDIINNWFVWYCIGVIICLIISFIKNVPNFKLKRGKGYKIELIIPIIVLSLFSWITLILLGITWLFKKIDINNKNTKI